MAQRLLLALALLSFATVGMAQSTSATRDMVTVSADGQYDAQPDTAVIHFNISAQDKNSNAAHQKAQEAAEQVRQVLRSNGVDVTKAELSSYQFSPVYKYDNGKRTLTGYVVFASVNLKLKDFSKVGPLVDQFGQLPTTDSMSVGYTLENMDAAKAKALENAYTQARAEAQTLAAVGGRTLGEMARAEVDESAAETPVPRAMYSQAMPTANAPGVTAEFSPQSSTVHTRVRVTFLLK